METVCFGCSLWLDRDCVLFAKTAWHADAIAFSLVYLLLPEPFLFCTDLLMFFVATYRVSPLVKTVYKATDFATDPSGGKLSIKFEPNDPSAETIERVVHDFDGPGVAMGMFNTDASIESFARGTMTYAESRDLPVILGHKSTILKQYDEAWIRIFERIHKAEFPKLDYDERLIDDLVAFMMKNEEPVLYALKNYDGDVISDITAQGFVACFRFSVRLLCLYERVCRTGSDCRRVSVLLCLSDLVA